MSYGFKDCYVTDQSTELSVRDQAISERTGILTDVFQMGMGLRALAEKSEGLKKYQLTVIKQSKGCQTQHGEYSQ